MAKPHHPVFSRRKGWIRLDSQRVGSWMFYHLERTATARDPVDDESELSSSPVSKTVRRFCSDIWVKGWLMNDPGWNARSSHWLMSCTVLILHCVVPSCYLDRRCNCCRARLVCSLVRSALSLLVAAIYLKRKNYHDQPRLDQRPQTHKGRRFDFRAEGVPCHSTLNQPVRPLCTDQLSFTAP